MIMQGDDLDLFIHTIYLSIYLLHSCETEHLSILYQIVVTSVFHLYLLLFCSVLVRIVHAAPSHKVASE